MPHYHYGKRGPSAPVISPPAPTPSYPAAIISTGSQATSDLANSGTGPLVTPSTTLSLGMGGLPSGWVTGDNGGKFLDNQGNPGTLDGVIIPEDWTVYLWSTTALVNATVQNFTCYGGFTIGYENGARPETSSTLVASLLHGTFDGSQNQAGGAAFLGFGGWIVDHNRFQQGQTGYLTSGTVSAGTYQITNNYLTEGGLNPPSGWHGEHIHLIDDTVTGGLIQGNLHDLSGCPDLFVGFAGSPRWTAIVTPQVNNGSVTFRRNIYKGVTALNTAHQNMIYEHQQGGTPGATLTYDANVFDNGATAWAVTGGGPTIVNSGTNRYLQDNSLITL